LNVTQSRCGPTRWRRPPRSPEPHRSAWRPDNSPVWLAAEIVRQLKGPLGEGCCQCLTRLEVGNPRLSPAVKSYHSSVISSTDDSRPLVLNHQRREPMGHRLDPHGVASSQVVPTEKKEFIGRGDSGKSTARDGGYCKNVDIFLLGWRLAGQFLVGLEHVGERERALGRASQGSKQ